MALPHFNGSILGPSTTNIFRTINTNAALNTFAMAALDAGFCARHDARSTLDVKAVKLIWNAVNMTDPGTFTLRYETIDATTGDPTGTLYDASAVITGVTPATAGTVQTITFAVLPTAGRTIDTMYGVVLITDNAATTMTLRSHIATGGNGAVALTTATAVTRSSFAPVNQSTPAVILVMEDDSEEVMDMCPYSGAIATVDVYGADLAAAAKFTLLTSQSIAGVFIQGLAVVGSPAGDVRVRILDTSNALVTGASKTLDKDYVTLNAVALSAFFSAPVTLPSGTYRVVIDSTGSANSSNCFRTRSLTVISATAMGGGFMESTTTNMSTTFTWTDSTTVVSGLGLILAVDVAAGVAIPGNMSGGMQ